MIKAAVRLLSIHITCIARASSAATSPAKRKTDFSQSTRNNTITVPKSKSNYAQYIMSGRT